MKIVNLTVNELLKNNPSINYRIVKEDNKLLPVTSDFVIERLNLIIRDKKIVDYFMG